MREIRSAPAPSDSAQGVCSLLGRAARPTGAFAWLCLLLVLCNALGYWAAAAWVRPGESWAVRSLYRGDDIQYYPHVAALARGNLRESVLADLEPNRLRSFPFASVAPHALLFAFLGPGAFVAGDVLASLSYYLLATALLMLAGARPWLARGAAVLMTLPLKLLSVSAGGETLLKIECWGNRFPRPLVSEPIFLAFLLVLLGVVAFGRTRRSAWGWIGAGVTLSLLLQSDLHLAIVAAFTAGAAGAWLLAEAFFKHEELDEQPRPRCRWRALLFGALVFVAAFAVTSIPFLLQRWSEHPDIPRRFGVFPVDRWHPLFAPRWTVQTLVAVGAALGAAWAWRKAAPPVARAFAALAGLCALAWGALPLSCVILGKTVQPYHFPLRQQDVTALVLVLAVAALAEKSLRLFGVGDWGPGAGGMPDEADPSLPQPPGSQIRRFAPPVLALVFAGVCIHAIVEDARDRAGKSSHMRAHDTHYPEWASLPNYRTHFSELTRELQKPLYTDRDVLATFDHQLMSWWLTYRGGHLYLAETFLSTAEDDVVEERLGRLTYLLGMEDDAFDAFLKRRYVLNFWYGLAKFQASRAYCFKDRKEYTEEQRLAIEATDIYDSWHLQVPLGSEPVLHFSRSDLIKEADRPGSLLVDRYRPLSIIILSQEEAAHGWGPPAHLYELTYRNPCFVVWVLRKIDSPANEEPPWPR